MARKFHLSQLQIVGRNFLESGFKIFWAHSWPLGWRVLWWWQHWQRENGETDCWPSDLTSSFTEGNSEIPQGQVTCSRPQFQSKWEYLASTSPQFSLKLPVFFWVPDYNSKNDSTKSCSLLVTLSGLLSNKYWDPEPIHALIVWNDFSDPSFGKKIEITTL